MKKIIFGLAAVAMLAMGSCSKEQTATTGSGFQHQAVGISCRSGSCGGGIEECGLAGPRQPFGRFADGAGGITVHLGVDRTAYADTVVFHYKGVLPGGRVFDDTAGGEPLSTVASGLVPGMTKGLAHRPFR